MSEREQLERYVEELVQPRDPAETKKWYIEWANKYDKDISLLEYNGPELAVTTLVSLGLPKEARILDIGTGTGSVGLLLNRNGYANIDGLDATPEMLAIAKQKNCYTNLINSFVTKDTKLPLEDKTYDAVIMAGCLCPGHIKWDSFGQIIRVVKPGGIILWTVGTTEDFEARDEHFRDKNNEKLVQELCDQHKWTHLKGFPKKVENYLSGSNGNVFAMRVL